MLARPVPATAPLTARPDPGPHGLATCDALLARHLRAVVALYGNNGLGVIDLPPLAPETVVAEQVGVAAVLYWCREVERAGVLPLVEALAQQIGRGALALPVGASAQHLMQFWRRGEHRFTAAEREALYARMFPGGRGSGFDERLELLAEWLVRIGRERADRGITHLQARAGQAALMLAQELSERAVGITAFAARDIVAQIRRALEVLRDPELLHALGGGTPWRIVQRWAPRLLGRDVDVVAHVTRAESGLELLRWLAASAPDVPAAARGVAREHPIIRSAETWRSAGRSGA